MPLNDSFDFDPTTYGNNSDVNGNNVAELCLAGGINNAIRAMCGIFLRAVGYQGADIASATTTSIAAANTGLYQKITGTTTITSFGTVRAGTFRIIEFTGILTLTHNATSLKLPGSTSITTAAGDVAFLMSLGSGNWKALHYARGDGSVLGSVGTSSLANDAVTYAKMQNVSAASRWLGRGSAGGAGNAEEGTFGAGLTLTGTVLTATGRVAQRVFASSATYQSCPTDLPCDNSIPTETEGDEVLSSGSITPTNASSTLDILVHLHVGASSVGQVVAALYVDGTAAAINFGSTSVGGTGSTSEITIRHSVTAGSTSARTYKVRLGPDVGGPASAKLNGDSAARLGGGVQLSSITVAEYLP